MIYRIHGLTTILMQESTNYEIYRKYVSSFSLFHDELETGRDTQENNNHAMLFLSSTLHKMRKRETRLIVIIYYCHFWSFNQKHVDINVHTTCSWIWEWFCSHMRDFELDMYVIWILHGAVMFAYTRYLVIK